MWFFKRKNTCHCHLPFHRYDPAFWQKQESFATLAEYLARAIEDISSVTERISAQEDQAKLTHARKVLSVIRQMLLYLGFSLDNQLPTLHLPDPTLERTAFEVAAQATATVLGIPKQQWKRPEVQDFLELLTRVEYLQADMALALARSKGQYAPAQQASSPLPFAFRELPDDPLPIPSRYSSAELLLRAVKAILAMQMRKHDRHDTGDMRYIHSKADAGLSHLGFEVVERSGRPDKVED